jgi:hypothetical protein
MSYEVNNFALLRGAVDCTAHETADVSQCGRTDCIDPELLFEGKRFQQSSQPMVSMAAENVPLVAIENVPPGGGDEPQGVGNSRRLLLRLA